MKKKFLSGCMVLMILFCAAMTGCTSQDSIVGTWYSMENGDTISFYEDGTCTSSKSDEIAHYKQQEDGTLMLTWGVFGNEMILNRTDDIDRALDNDEYYFLSRDTFVLSGVECEKR